MSLQTYPYTHADHARACAEAAKRGQPFKQCVQVKYHGATQCGVIRDAWDTPDGHPMWKVELTGEVKGLMSFPVSMVRKCSGHDDRCVCASEERALF